MHGPPLERIVRRIPNFRGYSDVAERRGADRELRNFVVARVDRIVSGLRRSATRSSPLEAAELREVSEDLEQLRADLQLADRDYAGFFDGSGPNPVNLLAPVYARDEQIVETLVVLTVAAEEGNFTPLHLIREVRLLHRSLSDRTNAILVLAQTRALRAQG